MNMSKLESLNHDAETLLVTKSCDLESSIKKPLVKSDIITMEIKSDTLPSGGRLIYAPTVLKVNDDSSEEESSEEAQPSKKRLKNSWKHNSLNSSCSKNLSDILPPPIKERRDNTTFGLTNIQLEKTLKTSPKIDNDNEINKNKLSKEKKDKITAAKPGEGVTRGRISNSLENNDAERTSSVILEDNESDDFFSFDFETPKRISKPVSNSQTCTYSSGHNSSANSDTLNSIYAPNNSNILSNTNIGNTYSEGMDVLENLENGRSEVLNPLILSKLVKANKNASVSATVKEIKQSDQMSVSHSLEAERQLHCSDTNTNFISSTIGKPSRLAKSKNNITSLAYNVLSREKELNDFHASGRKVKQETRFKYGF